MNEEIIKFDPTIEELNKIVEVTKNISVSDLKDKKQLAIVKENRIALKNARIDIERIGKSLREDALKFQKSVIAKEKELIAIIEPEEDRLQSIEDKAKELAIREERLKDLPLVKERIENLNIVGYTLKTDEELLSLNAVQVEVYFNSLVAYKNEQLAKKIEQERIEKEKELLARENKIKEEKEKIEREKQIKEAEERARKETEERLKAEAIEKEKKIQADKLAEEQRKIKEEKELQKKKKYTDFLKDNGYTKENAGNFKIERKENSYVLYKLIAVLED